VLDQIGLADEVLQQPHGIMRQFSLHTAQGIFRMADFSGLKTRFPYIAMLPQARFLDFIAGKAKQFPSFHLVLGANVQRLVEENGVVKGVRYRDHENQWHEVRAELTVAADGRFSRIRHLCGLEPVGTAPPMDVLWFRLSRRPTDPADQGGAYIHDQGFFVLLDRADEWQVGGVIPKDGFQKVRAAGIEKLRESLTQSVPFLHDRVAELDDWKKVTVLSVASNRLEKWHRPGLLFIGDAAHTMSPVGGVGINYAVQDAVETANVLIPKFKAGGVSEEDLAEVQRRREGPTRFAQKFQGFIQERIVGQALDAPRSFRMPCLFRLIPKLPILRRLPARMLGFGPKRVHLEHVTASDASQKR
jgi:2-polyprenyl-6-methoxyphenol hydroxylase-like FAD-dependent oxidoreductase